MRKIKNLIAGHEETNILNIKLKDENIALSKENVLIKKIITTI